MPEKAILAVSQALPISVLIVLFVVIIVLITFSALISGSEIAYFSLDAKKRDSLSSEKTNRGQILIVLDKQWKVKPFVGCKKWQLKKTLYL